MKEEKKNRQFSALSSKVGRTMILIFCLSAFLPMLVLSIFSYKSVDTKLKDQVVTSLHEDTKKLAILVNQELALFESQFKTIAKKIESSLRNGPKDLNKLKNQLSILFQTKQYISSINLFSADTEILSMGHSISPLLVSELQKSYSRRYGNKINISVKRDSESSSQIYFTETFDQNNKKYFFVMSFDVTSISLFKSVFDVENFFCVLTRKLQPVVCDQKVYQSVKPIVEKKLFASNNAIFENTIDGHNYISYYWTLFLRGKFNSKDWIVIINKPKTSTLSSLTSFAKFFTYTSVVAILFAVFLSLTQIRRILYPLHQLKFAIEKLKLNKFNVDVDINTDDEFGLVAKSFNEMSKQIGNQFHTLETLAVIDKSILSSGEIDKVVEIILKELPNVVQCQDALVLIMDNQCIDKGRLLYLNDEGQISTRKIELTEMEYEQVVNHKSQLIFHNHINGKSLISSNQELNNKQHIAFPIVLEEKAVAAILLSIPETDLLNEDSFNNVSQFVDRIAVALTNYQWQEKLFYQAHYDFLTGLPNRLSFTEKLESSLKEAARTNKSVALLFLDLDRFKNVNDSLGHDYGDKLLKEAGKKLRDYLDDNHFLARLGGDEFTMIIMQNGKGSFRKEVSAFAEGLYQSLHKPISFDNTEMFISISIGISISPEHGNTIIELLKKADIAMHQAKEDGKNHYQFFDEDMNKHIAYNLYLDNYLRTALNTNKFELFYQPQYEIATEKLVGCEVLLRLKDEKGNFISPEDFVPIAEESGVIVQISEWIINSVFEKISHVERQFQMVLKFSINLSAIHMRHQSLVSLIINLAKKHHINPSSIMFEITESTLIQNLGETSEKLNAIHHAGFKIAIDDFGTGYSSIALLTQLPFSTLKIDKTFIKDIHHSPKNSTVVKSIIDMAHNLKLNVIAEGVERIEEQQYLKKHNCDIIQGFYYSPPLSDTDFFYLVELENMKTKTHSG